MYEHSTSGCLVLILVRMEPLEGFIFVTGANEVLTVTDHRFLPELIEGAQWDMLPENVSRISRAVLEICVIYFLLRWEVSVIHMKLYRRLYYISCKMPDPSRELRGKSPSILISSVWIKT